MTNNPNKLVLNQETLRNITEPDKTQGLRATHNHCVPTVGFPVCTPKPGIN